MTIVHSGECQERQEMYSLRSRGGLRDTKSGCYEYGINVIGDMYPHIGEITKQENAEQCQIQCMSYEKCTYWNWHRITAMCYLRFFKPTNTSSDTFVISGPKFCINENTGELNQLNKLSATNSLKNLQSFYSFR